MTASQGNFDLDLELCSPFRCRKNSGLSVKKFDSSLGCAAIVCVRLESYITFLGVRVFTCEVKLHYFGSYQALLQSVFLSICPLDPPYP